MSLDNIKSSENLKLENIIEKYNSLIFDEKNWIGKKIRKIAEVTYSYVEIDDGTVLNTTLFEDIGYLELEIYKKQTKTEREKNLKKAEKKLKEELKAKIELIDEALSQVKSIILDNEIENNKKDIFINSLEEKKNLLNYCLTGLVFELEKAGIKSGLTPEKEIEIEEELNIYDNGLFGGDIKENPQEVKISYEYLIEVLNKNKEKLSKEELVRLNKYISKIEKFLPKGYKYEKKVKPKSIEIDFLETQIPKKDYILGFNIVVEALDKLYHVIETNSKVDSISDGPVGVQFPSTEKFKTINIARFSKLSQHEIETHSITDYNSKQLIGNSRGAKSIEKDEGLAMLMEILYLYGGEILTKNKEGKQIIDINKIPVNGYFTKTLMGEILSNDELLDFLKISEKIDSDNISPEARYRRLKRNHKYGVQHKDTTYTRGLFKAIKLINLYIETDGKEGLSFDDLFLGKISFEETVKLKKIKQEEEKKGNKIELVKPLFIADMVLYSLKEKLDGKEGCINTKGFFKYLKEKYPILSFSEKEIRNISNKTKSNVYGIVNIMMKNIVRDKTMKIVGNKKNKFIKNYIDRSFGFKVSRVKQNLDEKRKNAS